MSELRQPGLSDAVKGGQSPPLTSAVLGGLIGVKQRLASSTDEVRIAALSEALSYGREGLELVVQIVKTETGPVQRAAYDKLYQKASESARIKLLKYAPGKAIYQTLTQHLSQLLDENFRKELTIGKYSRWAVSITAEQIPPMLCAIGSYGRPGLDAQERLNAQQVAALSFLKDYDWLAYRSNELDRNISASPFSYSTPGFEENTRWAEQLSQSDLFGVIWHVGNFCCRGYEREDNLNNLHERTKECLECLMQVAQGKQTYYQLAGVRYPLREPRI
jgi:hypothetical protein